MATFEQLYHDYKPLIDSIANEFGRTNHAYGADGDDFRQELAMWLSQKVEKVSEQEQELDERHFGRWLARCLRNECKDYAVDIKAQATGYERRDNYFYTEGEIEVLLDSVFDQEAWDNPPKSEDGSRTNKSQAEGNNWIATLVDVSIAFEKLDLKDQEMLRDFHNFGWRNKDLAEMNGVSESAMSDRHKAAVRRLQKKLGGPAPVAMKRSEIDPIWRGRHAIRNSHARATTGSDYDPG